MFYANIFFLKNILSLFQIDRLAQTYCNSSDDDSYQNENKRETKRTDLDR